jgi:hypothetical protein
VSETGSSGPPAKRDGGAGPGLPARPNYTKEAFLSRFNLAALASAVGLSAVTVNPLPLILAAGAELVYLGTVPGMRRYRQVVDARYQHRRRLQGYSADGEVYQRLSPKQQATVDALKELRDHVHENYRRLGGGNQILTSPSLVKIDKLISSFLRLLEQLNAYRRYLGATDRNRIEREVQELAQDTAAEQNERLKEIKSRRLKILEKRHNRFLRAEENREVISHQLAAIEDILRLMHEQSLTARDPQDISRMLDTLAAEVEETEGTIREMESFLQLQSEVDELMTVPPERT